ncbi:hypothetical protein R1sor_025602 [Riccia sorocarpa]|uniref:MULE transposase domain-containing protein n=1 Tax=Riccia sorocarpa TaxID=122646 RepID=A0ABD3GD00_9MARC
MDDENNSMDDSQEEEIGAEELWRRHVQSNPKIGVGQLRDMFRTEYGRQASYKSTWYGREIVLSHMGGGDAKSFQSIPAVCARLKAVDPNGHVDWEPQPDSRAFKRMFVCPSASGRAFPYMRPHVGLDACHSKNQRYPSFIMLATCLDGNNNISIIAYAIVDRENEENWVWFLVHLRGAVAGIDSPEIQYVSDRCKGIINAVRNIFPGASHVHCTIHLQRNVKQRFGTEMEKFFKVLHRCKTIYRKDICTSTRIKKTRRRFIASKVEAGLCHVVVNRFDFSCSTVDIYFSVVEDRVQCLRNRTEF